MTSHDHVLANQLLGRIAYFHVMFFEPTLMHRNQLSTAQPDTHRVCCRHSTEPDRRYSASIQDSPWQVLIEIGCSLPESRACNSLARDCCLLCAIAEAGMAIALCWQSLEAEAYGLRPSSADESFAAQVGQTLAAAYGDLDPRVLAECPIYSASQHDCSFVKPVGLPLSEELLGVWRSFRSGDKLPIESWLNHCSTLQDVVTIVTNQRGLR